LQIELERKQRGGGELFSTKSNLSTPHQLMMEKADSFCQASPGHNVIALPILQERLDSKQSEGDIEKALNIGKWERVINGVELDERQFVDNYERHDSLVEADQSMLKRNSSFDDLFRNNLANSPSHNGTAQKFAFEKEKSRFFCAYQPSEMIEDPEEDGEDHRLSRSVNIGNRLADRNVPSAVEILMRHKQKKGMLRNLLDKDPHRELMNVFAKAVKTNRNRERPLFKSPRTAREAAPKKQGCAIF